MNPGEITVIGLSGSPRKKGNTEQLLDSFLKGAADAGGNVEKILLSQLSYSSCKGCNACHKSGVCIMDDDATVLFDNLIHANCVALSSPIYTMGITTELKSFIDRAHYLWVRYFLLDNHIITSEQKKNRRGYFLSTAGMDQENVFDTAFPMLNALYNILGFSHCTDILAGNMDGYGGITGHPSALLDAYQEGIDAVTGIRLKKPCEKQVKK
ncbi:MAG: flavodoxin family protein [Methanomicrobiales archaeon]|nr:flavodoxin family protein [Methanomicrobiales archaeon]